MSRKNRSLPAIVLSPGVWQFIAEVGTATDEVEQSGQRLQAVMGIVLACVGRRRLRLPLTRLRTPPLQGNAASLAAIPEMLVAQMAPRNGPVFLHIRLPHEIGVDISSA